MFVCVSVCVSVNFEIFLDRFFWALTLGKKRFSTAMRPQVLIHMDFKFYTGLRKVSHTPLRWNKEHIVWLKEYKAGSDAGHFCVISQWLKHFFIGISFSNIFYILDMFLSIFVLISECSCYINCKWIIIFVCLFLYFFILLR